MVKEYGVKAELVSKRLTGNVTGVVTRKAKYDELVEKYGSLNVKTLTDAIANNELAMGYTDPFASSTGLNFLITALETFDSSDLLSEKAVQGFENSRRTSFHGFDHDPDARCGEVRHAGCLCPGVSDLCQCGGYEKRLRLYPVWRKA